jgi:hypothetical protein
MESKAHRCRRHAAAPTETQVPESSSRNSAIRKTRLGATMECYPPITCADELRDRLLRGTFWSNIRSFLGTLFCG